MIPQNMKYACYKGEHCKIMETTISSDLKKFDVFVKVVACSMSSEDCNSEAHYAKLINDYKHLGSSFSGTVLRIGPGVKSLNIGDNVAGILAASCKQSACAEYVMIEEYDLIRIPDNLNLMDVAVCLGDSIKAYIAFFYCAKVTRDAVVLILNGAFSTVSIFAQIARQFGLKVLCTCMSSVEKMFMETLKGCVDDIIDLSGSEQKEDTLYHECLNKTDNLGVDVVLDLRTKIEENHEFRLNPDTIISCLTIHGLWISHNPKLELNPPDLTMLYERCASISFLNEQAWLLSKFNQGKYQHILADVVDKMKMQVIRPPNYEMIELSALPNYFPKLHKDKDLRLVVSLA